MSDRNYTEGEMAEIVEAAYTLGKLERTMFVLSMQREDVIGAYRTRRDKEGESFDEANYRERLHEYDQEIDKVRGLLQSQIEGYRSTLGENVAERIKDQTGIDLEKIELELL